MINIKITYKGQEFKNITDAIEKAFADGIKNMLINKLKPFEKEIEEYGGEVIIDIPSNLENMKLMVNGISEELKNKIIASLK